MSRIAYLEDAQERDMPRRMAPQERLSGAAAKGQRKAETMERQGTRLPAGRSAWTPEMKATLERKLAAASPETRAFVARYMAENRA